MQYSLQSSLYSGVSVYGRYSTSVDINSIALEQPYTRLEPHVTLSPRPYAIVQVNVRTSERAQYSFCCRGSASILPSSTIA